MRLEKEMSPRQIHQVGQSLMRTKLTILFMAFLPLDDSAVPWVDDEGYSSTNRLSVSRRHMLERHILQAPSSLLEQV